MKKQQNFFTDAYFAYYRLLGRYKTKAVQDKKPYTFKCENVYDFAADEQGNIYYISYAATENPDKKLIKESDNGTVEKFDGLFEPVDFILDLRAGDGVVYCAANYIDIVQ